jgi:hypothetical protein
MKININPALDQQAYAVLGRGRGGRSPREIRDLIKAQVPGLYPDGLTDREEMTVTRKLLNRLIKLQQTEPDDETVVLYPDGIKSTIYITEAGGGLMKEEVIFYRLRILKKARWGSGSRWRPGPTDVPEVQYQMPGRPKEWHRTEREETSHRFILVMEGWGHPEPPPFAWRTVCPIHDRVNYRSYLARFRETLLAHSQKTGRKLIVDVHEAISAQEPREEEEAEIIAEPVQPREEEEAEIVVEILEPQEVPESMIIAETEDEP